jgi:mannan polymerase II complex MNN10 subunit
MEPSRSLHQQIFSHIDEIAVRNISQTYNPLDIPDIPHVDYTKPMDILVSQDCSGFNLGSFLIRRSEFTRRVLDMWWDPILYEQKHMDWDHKEQDAFVHLQF